jgi:hypothetical protein
MGHGHDSDHPPARPGCDHDHDCATCGAAPVSGLAACPYCRAAYPHVQAGVRCPGCDCVNLAGRPTCAHCNGALTRACVFCMGHSFLDQPTCTRCHEPFEGADERRRARMAGAPVPHKADPGGVNIFNTLNSILKS